MTYVTPHLIQAHASLIHAPTPYHGSPRQQQTPTQTEDEWKITGRDRYSRPDEQSEWDPWRRVWTRKWLPGEKEAEAQQRIGDVKVAQQQEMADHNAKINRQEYDYKLSAEQRAEVAKINSALDDARKSGRYTDDEMKQLEREADAKRLGIKPLPTPKDEPPKPVFHTDEQGREWIQDGNGWKSVDEMMRGGQKNDFAAMMKLVPESRTVMKKNDATGKMEPTEVPLTVDERMDELRKLMRMRDMYMGREVMPQAEAPEQPDPLTQTFMNYMGMGAPQAGQPAPAVQPAATQPAATAPETQSDVDNKWSAFRGK